MEEDRTAGGQPVKVTSTMSSKKRFSSRTQNLNGEEGEVIPSCWENFIGGKTCGPFGWIIVLLCTIIICSLGMVGMKMSQVFGFLVLSDPMTAAYFAHEEILKDIRWFADTSTVTASQMKRRREVPGPSITIFYEMKDTECPGDDCDLKKKNLITAGTLGKIQTLETRILSSGDYTSKYCSIFGTPHPCRPPKSLLQTLLFGNGAATKTYQLIQQGNAYGTLDTSCVCSYNPSQCSSCASACTINGGTIPSTCTNFEPCSFVSPLDPGCSSAPWHFAMASSGADAPQDYSSYTADWTKLCNSSSTHWSALRRDILPAFACQNNFLRDHGTPFLRSQFTAGFPYKEDKNSIDWEDEIDDFTQDHGADMYKFLSEHVEDVFGEEFGDDNINVVIVSQYTAEAQNQKVQLYDMSFMGMSFLFVFLYMWFNVESCFLAAFGMFQVCLCCLPAFFIWYLIDQRGFQFLQMMALFLILGIGADDVFVLNDAFKQAKFELAQDDDVKTEDIFAVAYRRSCFAMLSTTLTTAWAFFFGVTNKIPAIANFCLFAAIIVTTDFLFCITMFASSVAFHDKYMAGRKCCCCGPESEPGNCCAPGCCFGCTRILWRKALKIPAEDSTDQRAIERFFSGTLYNFVLKWAKFLVGFWVVCLIAAIALTTQVKIASKDPQGMPAGHPIQRASDLQKEYFTAVQQEVVHVSFGLDDEEPVEKWSASKSEKPDKMKFGNIGWAISTTGQQRIYDLCKAVDVPGRRCDSKSCLVSGHNQNCHTELVSGLYNVTSDPLCKTGRYCLMEQVRDYAQYKQNNVNNFPYADFNALVSSTDFKNYMMGYVDALRAKGQHWNGENYMDTIGSGVVLDGNQVKYMYLSFNASFEGAFKPPDKGDKIYDDWKSFVESFIEKDKHHMTTMMFSFKVMQDILLREAIKNIFVSLFVAWFVLALVTWNWYVALLGMLNIAFIMVLFMGWWPILGWELDIFNIIYLIMCVGLSVDYTVHLLHAFNESSGSGREERMKDALSDMGITILSGALTTLLAAIPLFLCTSVFLQRFGTFIFFCIFFSIVTAIFLLTPLVLLIGPNGNFGDIAPLYWLRDRCKNRGDAKVAPENQAQSENYSSVIPS